MSTNQNALAEILRLIQIARSKSGAKWAARLAKLIAERDELAAKVRA